VKDGRDLQRLRLGPVDDQIRIGEKKFHVGVGEILTAVPSARRLCQKGEFLTDGGLNAVRDCQARLFFDVTPDFDEIERGLRRKNVAHAHLGLIFQFSHVGI